MPYLGLETAARPAWANAFLSQLASLGLVSLAAADAGITLATVRKRRESDTAFAEQYDAAQQYYGDRLEWESVELGRTRGNPLPYFARLKAERPARYIEKSIAVTLGGDAPAVSDAHARTVLREMLGHVTPATLERLTGDPGNVVPLSPPASDGEPWTPGA